MSYRDLAKERWLAEAFRPAAMVWVLRCLEEGFLSQAELIQAGHQVGFSMAAVRHAIEVGQRTGLLHVEKAKRSGHTYQIRASEVGLRLLRTPMQEWEKAEILEGVADVSSSMEALSRERRAFGD